MEHELAEGVGEFNPHHRAGPIAQQKGRKSSQFEAWSRQQEALVRAVLQCARKQRPASTSRHVLGIAMLHPLKHGVEPTVHDNCPPACLFRIQGHPAVGGTEE